MKKLLFFICVLIGHSIICYNDFEDVEPKLTITLDLLAQQEIRSYLPSIIEKYTHMKFWLQELQDSIEELDAAINIENHRILVATSSYGKLNNKISIYNNDLSENSSSKIKLKINSGDLNHVVKAISVQTDGKILIGGGFLNGKDSRQMGILNFYISRLNSDFSLDRSFNSNNLNSDVFTVNNSDLNVKCSQSRCECIVVQPDNKIVAAIKIYIDDIWHGLLLRLNSDGSLDLSFGKQGIIMLPCEGLKDSVGKFYSILITDNSNILVSAESGTTPHLFVFSIDSSGNLLTKVEYKIVEHDDSASENSDDSSYDDSENSWN